MTLSIQRTYTCRSPDCDASFDVIVSGRKPTPRDQLHPEEQEQPEIAPDECPVCGTKVRRDVVLN